MNTALLGFAQADITPIASVQTVGFGRADERSRGILQPLCAQVSLWRLGTEGCCLVAIDHIGFTVAHSIQLRDRLASRLSLSREQVMLCFSHTHSAPNESLEPEYFAFLCQRVEEAAQAAQADMRPVRCAWGNAYGDIGINRRSGKAMLDRRIGVLKVVDAESGTLRLLLLRLTAHPNVLKEDNHLISPDYFASVRNRISARCGCPVLLTQGACGDIAPKYFVWPSPDTPPDYCGESARPSALEDMAAEVERRVLPVLDTLQAHEIKYLRMYSTVQPLEADVPSWEQAQKWAEEAAREAHIDGSAWLAEVRRLLNAGMHSQTEFVELQYFAVNEGCLCGVPNELMCAFALCAQAASGNKCFYLGGYTNGCTGYFPTEEEYDKGGYEVFWSMLLYYMYHGRVAPLNRDSAGKLLAAVRNHAPGVSLFPS